MTGRETAVAMAATCVGIVIGGFGFKMFFAGDVSIDTPDAQQEAVKRQQAAEDLDAENGRLRAQIASLNVELNRQKLAAAEQEEKSEEQSEEKVEAKKLAAAMGVAFDDPNFQEALAKIDWVAVGTNMKDIVPLVAQLAEAMAKGERPNLADVGQIRVLSGELLKAAEVIMNAKIPGSGINGAFTHPVVVANQFSAALRAAGFELSSQQQEDLRRVMQFYAAKDESLRLVAGDRELALENLGEEAEFKDAFYKEARALLSEEQQNALFSKHSDGRTGLDMFDSSLMLAQYARPMRVKDPAHLASSLFKQIQEKATLSKNAEKQLNTVLAKWSQSFPAEYWANKSDALENQGMMKSARIRSALRRQQALMREILANVELSEKDQHALRKRMVIFVPLPR